MKKIGIMSMQRIYNYGSFLQAYGLKKMIEQIDSNTNVKFIDYSPGEPLVSSGVTEPTGLKRIIHKINEYNQVNTNLKNKFKFFNHKRTYAKRFYPILGITDKKTNSNGLDTLVIGSDEVFNCVQENVNVGYSKDLFGYGSEAKKTISYAASFGNTTLKKIRENGKEQEISEMLANFDELSVRDKNSATIIEDLIGKKTEINVDPVLAYDFMNLEEQIPESRLYNDDYLVVYGYSGRFTINENKLIKEYAKDNGYKILCFGGIQECCDEFIDCNPFELLAYFRDANAIITDTFHGSIFSIINNKQFCTLIRRSDRNSYGNEEKLSYLLDTFGLSKQTIFSGEEMNFETILNNYIDYDEVNQLIEVQRNKAINYLENNLT